MGFDKQMIRDSYCQEIVSNCFKSSEKSCAVCNKDYCDDHYYNHNCIDRSKRIEE